MTDGVDFALRVRLRPTRVQIEKMLLILAARLWLWNWAVWRVAAARREGRNLSWIDLSSEFTFLRRNDESFAWLRGIPREPLQQTLRDFGHAQKNYFAGGFRAPRRKRMVRGFRCMLDQRRGESQVDRLHGNVSLPGVGRVRFRVTQPIIGRLRNVTVAQDTAGRWYASFSADGVVPREPKQPSCRLAVGIDLGLAHLATCSDGSREDTSSRHYEQTKKKLHRAQRKYMRQRDAALLRLGVDPQKPIQKGTKIPESGRMLRRWQAGPAAQIYDANRTLGADYLHRRPKCPGYLAFDGPPCFST